MDDGTIEFACHELHYNKKGKCMAIPPQPNSPIPKQAKIMALQIIEQDGLVWIWTGDAAKAKSSVSPGSGYAMHRPASSETTRSAAMC